MRVLVLGATGMLGFALLRVLSEKDEFHVFGSVRSNAARMLFTPELAENLVIAANLENTVELENTLNTVQPDVVINCTSLGNPSSSNPMPSISIFSVLPQRLAHLCRIAGIRLVQISSDGVFSGSRGGYCEDDMPDGNDIYAVSKLLGEVRGHHAITLRTSIIGHQLKGKKGLLEWFLAQEKECHCYTHAIFSGFPTVVLGRIIGDHVLSRPDLSGIYHVASPAISKFDLLALVAERYSKDIKLIPNDEIVIDRSLSGERFAKATGFTSPQWPQLIDAMYVDSKNLENT